MGASHSEEPIPFGRAEYPTYALRVFERLVAELEHHVTILGDPNFSSTCMRVTTPGGLDKIMQLYVAANLSKYLYTWDPIGKRSTEDDSRLNSFGCGPDTPLSEGTWCLETYRVQLPPEMGFNESVDLDLHVDVAQNPNATCVWSVDRVYRSFAQFHKRGRGLCS